MLAGLASQAIPFFTSTVLPALGVGALSGLAIVPVYKNLWVMVYISRKVDIYVRLKLTKNACFFEPVGVSVKLHSKLGDGLYLKKNGKMYDGRGLLLGPNSPFKNIPILSMLL